MVQSDPTVVSSPVLPGPGDVSRLLGEVLHSPVEVVAIEPDPTIRWLGLYLFTMPDGGPVAALGADIPLLAYGGARFAGDPSEGAEEGVKTGRINRHLFENFTELAGSMATLLTTGEVSTPTLCEARRMSPTDWERFFAAGLPTTTLEVKIEGYGAGAITFVALAGAPADRTPLGLGSTGVGTTPSPSDDGTWRPYSFRKPSVDRGVLRALEVRSADVVAAMARACGGLLGNPMQQRVRRLHHTSWKDYAATFEAPTVFISFELAPLSGRFLLAWPADLAMALIDLMLGGTGAPLDGSRTPSPLDLSLLERLFSVALAEVPSLFTPFASPRVTDVRVDLDVHLVPGMIFDTFFVVWMSTEVAGVEYQPTLGIPTLSVRPFSAAIRGQDEDEGVERIHPGIRRRLIEVPVDVGIGFQPVAVPATRLLGMNVGDVLPLGLGSDTLAKMSCDAIEVADVEPLTNDDRLLARVARSVFG